MGKFIGKAHLWLDPTFTYYGNFPAMHLGGLSSLGQTDYYYC